VLDEAAEDHLLRLAGGDARKALTILEAAAGAGLSDGVAEPAGTAPRAPGHAVVVGLETMERAIDVAAVRYDRDGDQHYDVISAFIKSCRGSDVDAALHYLARMLEAGEDPRFIARRLIILASEDVGLADPTALQTAVAAAQAVQLIGLPEGRLTLAQATVAIALAPKSNAVTTAIGAAEADVRRGLIGPVPAHLRDSHYSRAADLGHGVGYVYPHDLPGGVAPQQYGPDQLGDRRYYEPTRHGAEARYADVLERLRVALGRDAAKPQEPAPDPPVGSESPTPGEEA